MVTQAVDFPEADYFKTEEAGSDRLNGLCKACDVTIVHFRWDKHQGDWVAKGQGNYIAYSYWESVKGAHSKLETHRDNLILWKLANAKS